MEHKHLTLEYDRNLINSLLNNINTKYTILYLYIIKKVLFKNLDDEIISNYERVIVLDDIYKDNVELLWDQSFIENIIELGLFKNIRSISEYDQKKGDFILKMGEYTITIEKKTILTPRDTLYKMISKKFKKLSQKDFDFGLTKLKEVRCESTGAIHHFIYEAGEREYVLSDDLYDILDQFSNIYQAIKIEPTSNGLLQICKEIQDNIVNIVMIFDPILNNDQIIKRITKVLEINRKIEKIEILEISLKINLLEKNSILTLSNSDFQILSNYKNEMGILVNQLLEIKSNYSGNQEYLGFLGKIPIEIETIQDTLIKIRDNASGAKKAVLDLENRIYKMPSDDFDLDYMKTVIKYQDINAASTMGELVLHCKEIKDKTVNFFYILNPLMSNKPVIGKIKKFLRRKEDIIENIQDETLEITEILINFKVPEKIIRLRISTADFKILSNYKDELERIYKRLLEEQSDWSESDSSLQRLGELRNNLIGARNSVIELEKRMILTKKIKKE